MTDLERLWAHQRLVSIKLEIKKLEEERYELEGRVGWCRKSQDCMQTDGHDDRCTVLM